MIQHVIANVRSVKLLAESCFQDSFVRVKAISIGEAQGQLGQLIAEACRSETIVLTDGPNRVTLAPSVLDLEEDSPELEAELLKAVNGPHYPLEEADLREIANQALREHRARQQ